MKKYKVDRKLITNGTITRIVNWLPYRFPSFKGSPAVMCFYSWFPIISIDDINVYKKDMCKIEMLDRQMEYFFREYKYLDYRKFL